MTRHEDLKGYERFQKSVFASAQESMHDAPEVHTPYGRCSRHPGEVTSNGMFDTPCRLCEEGI
jgi:hypothetical protein